MKKLALILSLIFVFVSITWASNVTMSWDEVPSTDEYVIAGYVVYFWDEAVPDKKYAYVSPEPEIMNLEYTLNLIPGKTYNFVVAPYTTRNVLGEESPEFSWVASDNPAPQPNLPTHIYIPGPITITFDQQ